MAFLNNSGDIILDAVLTDEGRRRLSLSNGTFRIDKYALGDDEIDYSEWDSANSSGSAYYDLNILQTPILEAFTNNASSLKSKLVTYSSTNLLYLPVMKLNTKGTSFKGYNTGTLGVFVGLINPDSIAEAVENTVYGYSGTGNDRKLAVGNFDSTAAQGTGRNTINIAQGLDTLDIPFTQPLSPEQQEDKYLIEVDDRLVKVCGQDGTELKPAFVDDDSIATYAISDQTPGVFSNQPGPKNAKEANSPSPSVIAGPYQIKQLSFSLTATDNLRYSNYYFSTFGNTNDTASSGAGSTYTLVYSIDLNVSVTGQTTGYRIDIPVRIVKIITP